MCMCVYVCANELTHVHKYECSCTASPFPLPALRLNICVTTLGIFPWARET